MGEDMLSRFMRMRDDITDEYETVRKTLDAMMQQNKNKTATFKQLTARKLTLASIIETYRKYDLL